MRKSRSFFYLLRRWAVPQKASTWEARAAKAITEAVKVFIVVGFVYD